MKSFEELVLQWLDGTLTPEELRLLNEHLRRPEARAELRRQFAFEAELHDAVQAEKSRLPSDAFSRSYALEELTHSSNATNKSRDLVHHSAGIVISILRGWRFRIALTAALVTLCMAWLLWHESNTASPKPTLEATSPGKTSQPGVKEQEFGRLPVGAEAPVLAAFHGPWKSQDIGEAATPGMAQLEGDRCIVKSAGRNNSSTQNPFHFVHQRLCGDGEIVARIESIGMDQAQARAGLLIRETLDSTTSQAFLYVQSSGGLGFERKQGTESKVDKLGTNLPPCWIRLQRRKDTISAHHSTDGKNWISIGSGSVPMARDVYAGLAVISGDSNTPVTTLFDHISVQPFFPPRH